MPLPRWVQEALAQGQGRTQLVPRQKKLDSRWLAALTERGEPEQYTGDELRYIGMPVGGLCCGQLYLGGDGRLWLWDVFHSQYQSGYGNMSMGVHYADPPEPGSPVAQGFALRTTTAAGSRSRTLDREGFSKVSFRGEYPIGRVQYRDPDCPVAVDLEAFSPFCPLDHEDSALPVTVMSFTVTNESQDAVRVELGGWLENAVCPRVADPAQGSRTVAVETRPGLRRTLRMGVKPPPSPGRAPRPDIAVADFETADWGAWKAEGEAFAGGPFPRVEMAPYHDVQGHRGQRLVNSHNERVTGPDSQAADNLTGRLTSPPFRLERDYLTFLLCGGNHPETACVNLLADGAAVRTTTGRNSNRMHAVAWNVRELAGAEVRIEIVDEQGGPWGHIGIDEIVQTDVDSTHESLPQTPGYGSMALTLLATSREGAADRARAEARPGAEIFGSFDRRDADRTQAAAGFGKRLIGGLLRVVDLGPGERCEITFLVSWWFPYYPDVAGEFAAISDIERLNRHYENRFPSAAAVADYAARNFDRLAGRTRSWNATWYDSTLPYWLLDRTFVTLDCLATQTAHWLDNGRFWGWEGVSCCPGTCQHVWNYAQAMARVFPDLERRTRELVDYGIAYRDDGALDYRAESARRIAHDGQCGTILRVFREHTMQPDDAFLKRIWNRVRKSIERMMVEDVDEDGLLEGAQYNTLDQAWYGPMAWVSSMYLAALVAGETMARELGDTDFAQRCAGRVDSGRKNLVGTLFNGAYFIHKPDPEHLDATNTNDGCHIDQLFGQSLAAQYGLARVAPERECHAALESLWNHNFTPDAGGYREAMQETIKGGRVYATRGEAGLVMCTWPQGGADKARGSGRVFEVAVGYFNECMTGFEYQVAAHMLYEGTPSLIQKGLAIARAIHDRYAAKKRNPYNEVECSDHYSRAMASYGVFLGACGFEYHGPRGHLGFAPRLDPAEFKAAFTAAEGWGSISQRRTAGEQVDSVEVVVGRLRLRSLAFELPPEVAAAEPVVTIEDRAVTASLRQDGARVILALDEPVLLGTGETLTATIPHS